MADSHQETSGQSRTAHPSLESVTRHTIDRLAELTGRRAESVTSVEPTEKGWIVQLEVLESARIPDSTDILALYEAELDRDGRVRRYSRLRRYPRGRGDHD